MAARQLYLLTLCLAIAVGAACPSARETPARPAGGSLANGDVEFAQMSSKCATNTGTCWVPAQMIGSPCRCGDGSYGTIIP